jgi:hypothetical protein
MKLQKATKPATMEPHTRTIDTNSSFMRKQLSYYDKSEIMLHLHMNEVH